MKTYKISFLFLVVMSLLVAGCNSPKATTNSANQQSVQVENVINYENHKRPEGEYITLRIGKYKIGTDVKPGRFYVYKEKLTGYSNIRLEFRDENDKYLNAIYPGFDVPSISLIEGQTLEVEYDSIILSAEYVPLEDFYEMKDPGGTVVPKGIYHISKDIPAGSYELYPISFKGSSAIYYADEEIYERIKVGDKDYKEYELKFMLLDIDFNEKNYGQSFYLPEGSVFVLSDAIKMKKIDALNFN